MASSSSSSKNSGAGSSSSNNVPCFRDFEIFLQGWLVRQQHFHEQLQTTVENIHQFNEDYLSDLVSKVLSHYHEYYEQKSAMATRNVFVVFSPKWFTPFEKSLFWVGGFRPSMAFKVVETVVDWGELTEEQRVRMEMLRDNVAREEIVVSKEMASGQERVAFDPVIVEAVKKKEEIYNGDDDDDKNLSGLRGIMETALSCADSLRIATAAKVTHILNPAQSIKFLAAATKLQLKLRTRGMQLLAVAD